MRCRPVRLPDLSERLWKEAQRSSLRESKDEFDGLQERLAELNSDEATRDLWTNRLAVRIRKEGKMKIFGIRSAEEKYANFFSIFSFHPLRFGWPVGSAG